MEITFVGYAVLAVVDGFALFLTALVRNMFQGEDRDTIKDMVLASLFTMIGLMLTPVLGMISPVLMGIYPFAVIWVCFQLEGLADLLFFWVVYVIMSMWVHALVLKFFM